MTNRRSSPGMEPSQGHEGVHSLLAPRPAARLLSATERRLILAVLYFEIASNVGNGLVCIFSPELAVRPLSTAALTGLGREPVRWFGALNLVVAWLLTRVLTCPPGLRLVLEALLIGDVVYCASLVPFVVSFGAWPGVAAPFVLTALMFGARMRLLLLEDWVGAATVRAGKDACYSVLRG